MTGALRTLRPSGNLGPESLRVLRGPETAFPDTQGPPGAAEEESLLLMCQLLTDARPTAEPRPVDGDEKARGETDSTIPLGYKLEIGRLGVL